MWLLVIESHNNLTCHPYACLYFTADRRTGWYSFAAPLRVAELACISQWRPPWHSSCCGCTTTRRTSSAGSRYAASAVMLTRKQLTFNPGSRSDRPRYREHIEDILFNKITPCHYHIMQLYFPHRLEIHYYLKDRYHSSQQGFYS